MINITFILFSYVRTVFSRSFSEIVRKVSEIFGNFPKVSENRPKTFGKSSEIVGKSSATLRNVLGDCKASELNATFGSMAPHMWRMDVTEGTCEQAFTPPVYNRISNGPCSTIDLKPKVAS